MCTQDCKFDAARYVSASRTTGSGIPDELFELFPALTQVLHRRGGDLSGAQPSLIKETGCVNRTLADLGTMAIVLVGPYHDFAAEPANQYLVMERGEIVQCGRGKDMALDQVRQRMSI